jgi:anti-sigma regulatory factor (Ser/Thr protein kinase)
MKKLFTADFSQFSHMISYIREGLATLGCDTATRDRVHVICDEFITNIINHAYAKEPATSRDLDGHVYTKPLQISCTKASNQVAVELTDWGHPFNPLEYSGDPTGKRAHGGLGIGIAGNLADSIVYQRKNNKNILTCIVTR